MEPGAGDLVRLTEDLEAEAYRRLDGAPEITDEAVRQCLAELSAERLAGRLPAGERIRIEKVLFARIRGFDVLGDLLTDPSVTEILVNGPDQIFAEREGRLYETGLRFPSEDRLLTLIQRIAGAVNRRVNMTSPIADARLSDGSRVSMIVPPVSLVGPVLSIRKFSGTLFTLDGLVERGSLTQAQADFLIRAVREKRSVFISGGTGTGKTTFLNALSGHRPEDERVITIEDAAELQLRHVKNLVRLEAREANLEGKNAVTLRDLIRAALRMRPDRILVGEVRGPEVIDMLQAMNVGQKGSWSTGHANSAREMLTRLEVMYLMGMEIPLPAIRRQIADALDILVHLARSRDGKRFVEGIYELKGWAGDDYVLEPFCDEGPSPGA